jgi:hypothetical protein
MRSIQVFIIVLCLVAGLYLSTGIGFFLPDRWHPETGSSAASLPTCSAPTCWSSQPAA